MAKTKAQEQQSKDPWLKPKEQVYINPLPVRIWHWFNAACIVVLCITGYLIGKPLPSFGGEASNHFAFGYVRLIHFAAGQMQRVGRRSIGWPTDSGDNRPTGIVTARIRKVGRGAADTKRPARAGQSRITKI